MKEYLNNLKNIALLGTEEYRAMALAVIHKLGFRIVYKPRRTKL